MSIFLSWTWDVSSPPLSLEDAIGSHAYPELLEAGKLVFFWKHRAILLPREAMAAEEGE